MQKFIGFIKSRPVKYAGRKNKISFLIELDGKTLGAEYEGLEAVQLRAKLKYGDRVLMIGTLLNSTLIVNSIKRV